MWPLKYLLMKLNIFYDYIIYSSEILQLTIYYNYRRAAYCVCFDKYSSVCMYFFIFDHSVFHPRDND